MRPGRCLAVAAAACIALSSCRGAVLSLGASPAQRRARASDLLGALLDRFGPLERDASFASRRARLTGAALVPSRAYEDASLWTGNEGGARVLEFAGRRQGGRYRITAEPHVPMPAAPGEYRARLRLRALGRDEYEWSGRDELAVGAAPVGDLDRALTALLTAAERGPAGDARPLVASELPRAAAALGRLYTLESLDLGEAAGGGRSISAVVTSRPAGIEKEFPRYARYLRKYVGPARFRVTADDPEGGRWWEADGRDGRFTVRVRAQGGNLAPLEGAPRRIPERLRVRADFSTRVGLFRVGVAGLEADVRLFRAPRAKSFTAVFDRPPQWQLPFIIKPFLRASLRRPFEGQGALLSFAAREDAAQTMLVRDYRLAVRESWIVRWLGGRAQEAMDEFRMGAEEEADRFLGQALAALREDLRALAGGPAAGGSGGPAMVDSSPQRQAR